VAAGSGLSERSSDHRKPDRRVSRITVVGEPDAVSPIQGPSHEIELQLNAVDDLRYISVGGLAELREQG